MKRIGLIGGVSPESTVVYYRRLNAAAREKLGGEHSQDLVVHSLDYGQMLGFYNAQNWVSFKANVVSSGKALAAIGCDALAICSNTVQLAADDLAAAVDIPVLNLLDALSAALKAADVKRPLLLGTPLTMEGDFYRPTLKAKSGLDTIVPGTDDRAIVDRVIFDELCHGIVRDNSRHDWLEIIERGVSQGADCVILGCTEIGLLIEQSHLKLPVFDTTLIHTKAITDFAISDCAVHDSSEVA